MAVCWVLIISLRYLQISYVSMLSIGATDSFKVGVSGLVSLDMTEEVWKVLWWSSAVLAISFSVQLRLQSKI